MASNSLIHFWLLLCNHLMKFNETWLVSRSQHPLPSLWFLGRFENQDGSPGLWLAETFVFFSATAEQILTGSQISLSLAKIVFYGLIRFWKSRWLPWPLIGWDIFYFFSATAEQNLTKLDRKQDLNILSWVFFFTADQKTTWSPWPLNGWDIFYFSATPKPNLTKLGGKQDVNVL